MRKISVFILSLFFLLSFFQAYTQSRRTVPVSDGKANRRTEKPTPTPQAIPVTNPSGADETSEEGAVVDDDDVITITTNLVTIPVRVTDRKNRLVAGLQKEDFKIFENDVEQEIAYFSNEEQPFTVALVLDMSYSAKFKIGEIQAAALAFTEQLRPADKVMIVAFDEEVHLMCEPTSDRETIKRAIYGTQIGSGTSLYEAMDFVINKRFRKLEGRKAVVLFTDGVDTTSRRAHNMSNLRDALELDALIYPIRYDTFYDVQAMKNKPVINNPNPFPIPTGTPNPSPFPFPLPGPTVGTPGTQGTTPEEYRRAEEYLNEMALRTGGRVYEASTVANLAQAFSNIANELRQLYSLGYYPKDDGREGQRRRLKVRVNREGVAVKARDSYVVGKRGNN
jgi:von Willebrand factor type A domain.